MFLNTAQFSKQIYQSYVNSIYRSGLGSLRRGLGRTSGSEPIGVLRKTKAAMIWKKGWKGWKKLHSFGSGSNSNSKLVGESDSTLNSIDFVHER